MTTGSPSLGGDGRSVDAVAAVLALALHAGLVLAAPRAVAVAPAPRLSEVDLFEVETPPPRTELPEPPTAELPESPRVARSPTPDRAPRSTSVSPSAQSAAPAPADGPLDLSATVITGNEGIAFGGAGGGGSSSRMTTAAPPAAAAPAERVARGASDLSEDVRPPPGLDQMLEAYFPPEARALGVSGAARVRMRFDVTGRIVGATVSSEAPPGSGFGAACRRMLLDAPSWSPALDPVGAPIARVGRDFRCRFELR